MPIRQTAYQNHIKLWPITNRFSKPSARLLKTKSIDILVIGLPRSLDGEDTAQTRYVRTFADSLKAVTEAKLYFEDEALSSVRAEQLMQAKHRPIVKADIDSLAASYILDDFLFSHRELFNG